MSTSFCFEFHNETDRWFSYTSVFLVVMTIICNAYFALVTISKFYIPQQMPQILKVGSIASTITLTLCQLFNFGLWISKYQCNKFIYYIFGPIYVVLYGIGYVLLFLMFWIKVQSSTKDSIYRLSTIFVCFVIILAIIFIILTVLIIILLSTNKRTLGTICIGVAIIVNLILYLVLLIKLLSTLFYVFKATIILSHIHLNFQSRDEWINKFNQIFDSTNSTIQEQHRTWVMRNSNINIDDNSNNNDNNDNNISLSMIKALGIARVMIRITVCVSIVFASNVFGLILVVLHSVLSLHQNAIMTTLLHLCYSMDLMVNNICLLYQNQFAQQSYDKNCKLCNTLLKNIIFCTIDTNMKTIQQNNQKSASSK